MSRRRWSDDENARFMQAYEKHQCLWNTRHPDYKHRESRTRAGRAVIKEVKIPEFNTVRELKNKINNFRSTYAQEVRKIKESLYCDGKPYVPTLRWFPYADKFLRNVVSAKHPSELINEGSQNEIPLPSNNNDTSDPLSSSDTGSLQIDIKHEIEREDEDEFEVLTCILPSTSEDISDKPSQTSSGRYSSEPPRKGKRLRAASEYPETKVTSHAEEDEFHFFGSNVSSQLRSLPLENALACQSMILAVLREERLKVLKVSRKRKKSS